MAGQVAVVAVAGATTAAAAAEAAATEPSAAAATEAAAEAAAAAVAVATGSALHEAAAGTSDVDGLGAAVLALLDGELDDLVLVEATEALGLDAGLVDEELFAAIIGGDEAEALGAVEPLDLAGLNSGGGGDSGVSHVD
eukprot:TRINITY_DN1557_c0_g1_i1.p2 TRINITY_DN1557_c0_g1~~TRINITY_DN1557_c0_g1_i1.p2  ORF type:complete len:139 (+),score=13.21 TRINITY_DN1557_c0_g1_i1:767-1183(+)